MKKWKKLVLWIASILIVIAIGGAFAVNYAIDKMLGSMSGMTAEIMDNTGDEGALDPVTAPDDSNVTHNENVSSIAVDSTPSKDTPVSNNPSSLDGNSGEDEGNTGTVVTDPAPSENQSSDGNKGTGGYSASVSTDKAKEIEENVTLGEKAKVVTILSKRLSASDLSTMQSLASGGLTVEEKKQARTLMLEKLTEDECNELVAIAAKHGLSKGRSYAEVSKE